MTSNRQIVYTPFLSLSIVPSTVVCQAMVCATAMGLLAHDWPMASNQVGLCCGNTSRTVNKHLFVVFPALILDFLTFNKLLVTVVPSHVTCLIPSPGGVGLGVYLFKKETIRNPVSWSWMELDGGLVWSSNKFQRLRCPKSGIFDTFLEVYLLSNRISGPNSFS